jgi:diguanylate cyclase (GGDEF)-like protein
MQDEPFDLAAQQLVELLELVSSFSTEASAAHGAVERAAQVLEAEVAAVVLHGRVVHSVGFPNGAIPYADLVQVASGERDTIDVPRLGRCSAAAAELEVSGHGHLVLARLGDDGFTAAEWNLLRGMARILELSLQMLRTMDSLRQRQRLMEHLYGIQRSISRRMPLPEVLETVVAVVRELLGDDIVGLWLPDPAEPDMLMLVSCAGADADLARRLWRMAPAEAGATGHAMRADDLVVVEGYAGAGDELRTLTGNRLARTMAAPVRENVKVIGALSTASYSGGRTYSDIDEEILLAFAENVSLALTDAKTLSDMNEAKHDSLTGLATRALFLDRLGEGVTATGSSTTVDGQPQLALLFIDLDRFKQVNDTLGHAAGDLLLVGVAERIQAGLRNGDVAARFGGDEFAVMLPMVTAAQATTVAERIIAAVQRPYLLGGLQASVGASIGIAMYEPGVADADELMQRADAAMYQAKRNGRGRCEMFAPGMRMAPTDRPAHADVREALDSFVHRASAA